MTEHEHDRSQLGAYALGVLDPGEVTAIDTHVASCAECRQDLAELREMNASLGEVPPEAFLDGPPEDGDLLLQRTLRAVRTEKRRGARQRLALVAAGVVALAAAALGAGVMVGQQGGGELAAPTPAPTGEGTSQPGVRTIATVDRRTGATMKASVTPAAGWVRVHADVGGIAAGKRCQLVVVSRSGASLVAGSWLVSSKGEAEGTILDGAALVAASDVASIDVVTFEGEKLVSAPL